MTGDSTTPRRFPTPVATEVEKNVENYLAKAARPRRVKGGGHGPNLATAVRLPTPNVPNGGRTIEHAELIGACFYHKGKKVQAGLREAVRLMTPNARDWKDSGPTQGNRNSPNLGTQVGGQLNPTWVEWLMGWPIGWTDLGAPATDRFRQWCASHGKP